MIHTGICHGTLGELFQGPVVRDGKADIGLVSLPLKRYSRVRFTSGPQEDAGIGLAAKARSRRAIEIYLDRQGVSLPDGQWACDSELLLGKGMASSTADIVATIRCLDSLFQRRTPVESLVAILREIERSDSVFLDHYALYLSGRQEVVHRFGCEPRFEACYVDEGGTVDTEAMGPALLRHYESRLPAYMKNLDQALNAFAAADAPAIARCATVSAGLSQVVAPKAGFDALLRERERFRADGIVVAHTGTLLGYLFIRKLDAVEMGELSSFFEGLGQACKFAQTGF